MFSKRLAFTISDDVPTGLEALKASGYVLFDIYDAQVRTMTAEQLLESKKVRDKFSLYALSMTNSSHVIYRFPSIDIYKLKCVLENRSIVKIIRRAMIASPWLQENFEIHLSHCLDLNVLLRMADKGKLGGEKCRLQWEDSDLDGTGVLSIEHLFSRLVDVWLQCAIHVNGGLIADTKRALRNVQIGDEPGQRF